jgi:hypothetical protein
VVLGWPLVAALAHTGGAAGLVIVITGVLSSARAPAYALEQQDRGGVAPATMRNMAHTSSTFNHLSGGTR